MKRSIQIKIFLMSTLLVGLSVYGESTAVDSKILVQPVDRERIFVEEGKEDSFLRLISNTTLPKLKTLILCTQKEKALHGLEQLNAPHLQDLTLYCLELSSWKILKVKAFRNLRFLGFRSASIPKTSHARIFFPYLETLRISDNRLNDFTAFQKWGAPKLKEISLSRHIELQSFKGIDPFLKTLSSLSFTNMEIYSFKGLMHKALPHLYDLDLNCRLSDQALKEIKHLDLKNLKKLGLDVVLDSKSKYGKSRAGVFAKMPKDLTCFGSLDLSNVVHLKIYCASLAGLQRFHVPKLEVLDLSQSSISAAEIQEWQRRLGPKVKILKPSVKNISKSII